MSLAAPAVRRQGGAGGRGRVRVNGMCGQCSATVEVV